MSYNKVILIGHIGNEPEVRYMDHDFSFATFSLATGYKAFTTPDGRKVKEQTDWHRIVAPNQLAVWAERWVHKGMSLGVEGRLRYRNYTDRNGQTLNITEIVAERLFFVDSTPPKKQSEDKGTEDNKTPKENDNASFSDERYNANNDSEPF